MIILEPQDQGSSKLAVGPSPTLRLPEPVAGRSASPLPDYETSQAQHSVIFRKPSFPNRFDSRFWRFSFFALAIYVFLSVVIGIPLIVTRIAYRRSHPPLPNPNSLFLDENDGAAIPLNLPPGAGGMFMAESSTICDDWGSKNRAGQLFVANAIHTLSPNGLFSVRSNATDEVLPQSGGAHNLTVDINSDASESQVLLSVTLTTSSMRLHKLTHFCFASLGAGRGLSIYLPQNLAPTDYLTVDIRLLFPQTSRHMSASDLITYLPMFHQSFGYLSERVRFKNINIAGAGVDIICDALEANKIAVRTSFASITGNFNVTSSLKLDNIGGSIYTNATLINNPAKGPATVLALDTGNSDIVADVTMVAPSNARAPKFYATAKTFNGSMSLNVVHGAGTPQASLDLHVDNNQAPSTVTLDSKFAGLFNLHTKLAPAKVDYDALVAEGAESGSIKVWNFEVDSNSTSWARGWMGRGARPTHFDPATDSKVMVSSSLSPIILQLRT
ncbi:hypothetical protein C8R43DRAFT_990283 [Mycena crocata]|nr:hypothetical protein C8R43DRAFT_990283 [Mycena crocata]